jgi:hypothetical protein
VKVIGAIQIKSKANPFPVVLEFEVNLTVNGPAVDVMDSGGPSGNYFM